MGCQIAKSRELCAGSVAAGACATVIKNCISNSCSMPWYAAFALSLWMRHGGCDRCACRAGCVRGPCCNHFNVFVPFLPCKFGSAPLIFPPLLSGIMDIHMIFMIFGLTFVTMLFGSEMERTNAHLWGMVPAKSFRPFWYGCVPHIFNWAVILCYFFRNVSKGIPDVHRKLHT